jgi:hypothetical protein
MELTEKLKETVEKCENRRQTEEKSGAILNDEDLESVSGGFAKQTPMSQTRPDSPSNIRPAPKQWTLA